MSEASDSGRSSYLDFLVAVLSEKKSETSPEDQETLIYMKFRLSRSVNELLKILQSLKE